MKILGDVFSFSSQVLPFPSAPGKGHEQAHPQLLVLAPLLYHQLPKRGHLLRKAPEALCSEGYVVAGYDSQLRQTGGARAEGVGPSDNGSKHLHYTYASSDGLQPYPTSEHLVLIHFPLTPPPLPHCHTLQLYLQYLPM